MNELENVIPEGVLVDPVTMEVKTLAEVTNDELREGIEQMANLQARLSEARKRLATEAWARKNRRQPVEGIEVSRRRYWRERETKNALSALVERGVIPAEAEGYVYEVPTLKADGRALKALADGLIAEGKVEEAGILLSTCGDTVTARVTDGATDTRAA